MDALIWAAIVGGGLGVLGTVLGLIVSSKVTATQELQRWKREDQIRFQERVLVACQEFSVCSVQLATGFAHGLNVPTPIVEAFARSEQMITFLCSKKVRLSAAKIRLLLDASRDGVQDVAQFTEHLRVLRLGFDNALREEIGLPTSDPDSFFNDLALSFGLASQNGSSPRRTQ